MGDMIAPAALEAPVAEAAASAEEEAAIPGVPPAQDQPAPEVSEAEQVQAEDTDGFDESNESEEEQEETPAARKARQIVTFEPENETYEPGKCTVVVSLTIRPEDGDPNGRQVLIAAGTHDEMVEMASARLNDLALPGPVATLIERCELSLVERGKAAAERKAKEKAEEEARKARLAKRTQKPQGKAATPAKPVKKSTAFAVGATPPTADAGQPSLF
jgi:hypothetical protein